MTVEECLEGKGDRPLTASACLHRVEAGEPVLVMERGTPVARIVPAGLAGISVPPAKRRDGQDAGAAARLPVLFERRACIHFTTTGRRAASRMARTAA